MSRKCHALTQLSRVERSLEGQAPARVSLTEGSSMVEESYESHTPIFICFGAYIALCDLFLGFCLRFRGLRRF
jgi:hypothetical protein